MKTFIINLLQLRYGPVFMTLLILSISFSACKKFVEVGPPKTDLVRNTVFIDDATATAALSSIYSQMVTGGFASGDPNSFTFLGSLLSDEMDNYSSNLETIEFYDNTLSPTNSMANRMWVELYKYIYKANAIIEGISDSTGLTPALKRQLEGEAKFVRAFSHFYLINLFGDVPLILSTNYKANSVVFRTPKAKVYQQIIDDLKDAQNLLANDYSFSNNERVRPNKWAASALLARVYLFTQDWANAEIQSTAVIDNTTLYSLELDLTMVFLANSAESIWQLSNDFGNTWDASTFVFTGYPSNGALRQAFINTFEAGDNRLVNWIGADSSTGQTYYYPYKYKVAASDPIVEYSTVLRLSEQYLIRAEARVQQNNVLEGRSDLNIVRKRAGLLSIDSNDPAVVLLALEHERQVELFTEWGHRWLDLKRLMIADSIMGSVKPNWKSTDQLLPIPALQILNDPNMANAQNPGY